jgi:hypothetical protein
VGPALLERGKPDEAIAQFTIANQKNPRLADPLEMRREALGYVGKKGRSPVQY